MIKLSKFCLMIVSMLLVACGQETPTFSLLEESQTFEQAAQDINTKIDILWVIDNSGSMKTSQENLAANFANFISQFTLKSLDYRIAITTTEAYRSISEYNSGTPDYTRSKFKDGSSDAGFSGYFIIDPTTPDPVGTFQTNVQVGITGSGDERAFHSFVETLQNPLNSDFRRDDAHLAIIIVSDEDDRSHQAEVLNFVSSVDDPRLDEISYYTDFLDTYTNSTEFQKQYSVYSIAIQDQACLDTLQLGRKIGTRYSQLVEATSGLSGSLCENFDGILDFISTNIVQLTTQFFFDIKPLEDSIKVFIDEVAIDEYTEGAAGGWVYNEQSQSITFIGTAIPQKGQKALVIFDPETVEQ